MLPLTLLPSASSVRADEPDYFAETSFGVYQPLIRRFFFQQGGVATFGNPLSREFRFRGRAVQVFQQAVLATAPDRSVAPLDVAAEGLPARGGENFRAVLVGDSLAPELAAVLQGNPLLRQYDLAAHRGPVRPADLPDTDLTDAFRPLPYSNPAYGVVVNPQGSPQEVRQVLDRLNVRSWWGGYDEDDPAPYYRLHFLKRAPDAAAQVAAQPGSYWTINDEVNVPGQGLTDPDEYAVRFRAYKQALQAADPTAKLVAPNILNWEETCRGCPGITQGKAWVDQFRQAYLNRYREEPPVDVWAIHPYAVDWTNLPMVDAAHVKRELAAFRGYLDAIDGQRGKPIWVTELGLIWGYDGVSWREEAPGVWKASAVGAYRDDLIEAYLNDVLDWLETDGQALGIERWFVFGAGPSIERYAAVPTGLYLVDGYQEGSNLTRLGRLYTCRAAGLMPDADSGGCKQRG